jgi:hypothetical protein
MKILLKTIVLAIIGLSIHLHAYHSGYAKGQAGNENAIHAAYHLGKQDIILKALDHKPGKKNPGIKAAVTTQDLAMN